VAMRTALYDWHRAQGARIVEFAGWEMPVQYTSIAQEHQAVRHSAGLFDISHMGRLFFSGDDALDLIEYVYTNDAESMGPGQARYGLVCNAAGGILDDVLLYRLDQTWLLVVNASNREKILKWLDQHRGSRQLKIRDATLDLSMVAIQGPRSPGIVAKLLSADPWKGQWNAAAVTALKYYHAIQFGAEGQSDNRMIVSRTGYTGEEGFEIILPAGRVSELVQDLLKTAKSLGAELTPCGLGARNTLRLEAGMPLYGHELTDAIDPFQAGIGWAVKMGKGDFLGRDALDRRRRDAALPRRAGLELSGKRIAREGATVKARGRQVGLLTSGTFSPTLSKVIAMGYVEPEYAIAGTQCEVDVRGTATSARVVSVPFYRRPKP
jgi:aminomethyltransferase